MCFTFKCKQISKAQKTSEGSLQPEKDRPKKKKKKTHTSKRNQRNRGSAGNRGNTKK